MNGTSDNIIVNSCELTPIYLIQESGVTQATSYVLTPANQVEQKPVSNLKRFYESSGNLENSVLLNSTECSKPKILKKIDGSQIGNKLKLASFLVPKTSGSLVHSSASTSQNSTPILQSSPPIVQNNAIIVQNTAAIGQNSPSIIQTKPVQQVNNIVYKPAVATVSAPSSNVGVTINTIPKIDIVQNTAAIGQNSPSIIQTKPLQQVNNIVYKPVVATVSAPTSNVGVTINTISKIDMDRKIVKLKPCDTIPRHFHGRSVPKPKPKEVIPEQPRYTSVQLLKLGETYHSLNVLSDDQMKMVNQALNIIKDPEKLPTEPAYDPVTNTRFIYKIVSPKDLKVVGKNKVIMKEKRGEPRKVLKKVELVHMEEETSVPLGQAVTTRSGRRVRLPRAREPGPEPAPRARKRSAAQVTCIQCSAEFGSLYQLQKHHESHPTHAASRLHSTLFHCLLAVVAASPAEARARLFVQQLEQFVQRLRALLPCLLAGRERCAIGDDVGRILGVTPGKYNLDVDALNCVKDKDGHCAHNPPPAEPAPPPTDLKPSQLWLSKHKEETANAEESDCARINTVHKWPTINPKLWSKKQKSQKNQGKKIKTPPNSNELIDLGKELTILNTNECPNSQHKMVYLLKEENENKDMQEIVNYEDADDKSKPSHIQFHSSHFDIRSSPIKPSSTSFQKFQINPDQLEKLNAQVIRPLVLDQKPDEIIPEIIQTAEDCNKLDSIFQDEIEMTCKNVIHNELSFDSSKNWDISSGPNVEQSHENYMKSNAVIEPSLIHIKDDVGTSDLPYSDSNADMPILNDSNDNHDSRLTLSQSQSVLNFLESLGNECLTYPEPEIRNTSVDFQLDLFSFNNT